jgi:hypothetical protein
MQIKRWELMVTIDSKKPGIPSGSSRQMIRQQETRIVSQTGYRLTVFFRKSPGKNTRERIQRYGSNNAYGENSIQPCNQLHHEPRDS